MWPATLSGRLPVFALVGRYPTNELIGRIPLPVRRRSAFPLPTAVDRAIWGISPPFGKLSPTRGQVRYVLLTRPPLYSAPRTPPKERLGSLSRTTCMC